MEDNRVVRFGVSVRKRLFDAFEAYIAEKGYRKRSKAIRDLMRNAILDEAWKKEEGAVAAAVIIIYNHEIPSLTDKIIDIQHNYLEEVVFSSHIHVSKLNCMEIVVLRGKVRRIQKFASEFLRFRGVKLVKVVPSTTGEDVI